MLTYSIVGLDAQYTVSAEYCDCWMLRFVVRLNGRKLVSHPERAVAEKLARTHYNIYKEV